MRKKNLEQEIKELLTDVKDGASINPKVQYLMKMVGCPKCFGKGYGTQRLFSAVKGSKHLMQSIVFCDCARGEQLMNMWPDTEEMIRQKIVKELLNRFEDSPIHHEMLRIVCNAITFKSA